VPAEPLHREFEAGLIAAFGHKFEELVGAIDHVDAPPMAGIGVQLGTPVEEIGELKSALRPSNW
jgi:hypothetical protein